MKRYYAEDKEDKAKPSILDEDGNVVWNAESSSEEEEEVKKVEEEEVVEWSDEDVKMAKVEGKRFAVQNLDWDHTTAGDLVGLFLGFCEPHQSVEKVEIYPSDFGIEQMKHDALKGPPQEVFAEKVKQKKEIMIYSRFDVQKLNESEKAFNKKKL